MSRVKMPEQAPAPPSSTSGAELQALRKISEEIERSREILKLPQDWDEEGSPSYAEHTWKRAVGFLWNQAKWFWERHHLVIDPPRISPGPDGSIDIHWKTVTAELLVNVPTSKASALSFYGDTTTGSHIQGSIKDTDYKQALWLWLKEDLSEPSE
jgi:hypothetical protein